MPSTETQGQQPGDHIGGVGSLPGSKDEQAVAVLPEERATKVTERVDQEHQEEPVHQEHYDQLGALPNKSEKSPGVGDVRDGRATDPPKRDTESRVRAYSRFVK